MFFRRSAPVVLSFGDRLNNLRAAGFAVESAASNRVLVSRAGLAALVEDAGEGRARLLSSGLLLDGAIARLTDRGFQKVFLSGAGKTAAAQAGHLKLLHGFVEDLRESMGQTSLYNESLGTINERHLYDRVLNRDAGPAKRPWEK